MPNEVTESDFNQKRLMRFFGWLVHKHSDFWIDIGKLETRALKSKLDTISIEAPIYVTGLARSGTTLLLNIIASHRDLTSFKYCDYYGIFTPYIAEMIFRISRVNHQQKRERAHRDGMMVNIFSPEAMEEVLWMQFFDYLHAPETSNILTEQTHHPEFETIYRSILSKLILLRKAKRIVSKNNYNITRIPYLRKMYKDARCIIAVRHPLSHIASLMRQHELNLVHFSSSQHLSYLRNAGHFEFGINRIPITVSTSKTHEIQALWEQGRTIEGWAEYWNAIYQWTYEEILAKDEVNSACMVMPFEELCASPSMRIADILTFCDLDHSDLWIESWAEEVHYQPNYLSPFTDSEKELVMNICGRTAERFGYQ